METKSRTDTQSHQSRNEPLNRPRVLVLSALNEEFPSLVQHIENPTEKVLGEILFTTGLLKNVSQEIEIYAAVIGQGNNKAASYFTTALHEIKPNASFFLGVAGGLKDVKKGDVVFASAVHFYERGKVTDEAFLPRVDSVPINSLLEQSALSVARTTKWKDRITDKDFEPNAFVKPIVAGEKNISTVTVPLYDLLKTNYSDCLAVDMEDSGFMTAGHIRSAGLFGVVRGISDLLYDKSESGDVYWQPKSSNSAAAFLIEVIDKLASLGTLEKYSVTKADEDSTTNLHGKEIKLKAVVEFIENEIGLSDSLLELERYIIEFFPGNPKIKFQIIQ